MFFKSKCVRDHGHLKAYRHQRLDQNKEVVVMLLTTSNIRDIHHKLAVVVRIRCLGVVVVAAVAAAAARIRCFWVVVIVRIRCFAEDIVAAVAFAAAEAGRTVAVGAGIAVAASAEAEAGCTAAFAAVVEAGCTDLGVWAGHDCWMHRCRGFVHHRRRRRVLPSVVEPREPVGFLRGLVSAERGLAMKS